MVPNRWSAIPLFALLLPFFFSSISIAQETETVQTLEEYAAEKIRLVVRIDDIGFNHASNQALERLGAGNGVVTACSVIVNTGWVDEAVAIANKNPHISYGVHTCLNAEWKPYRWGPVLPVNEVPTLVDEWGHFHGTRADLMANNPNIDEIDREIRAQIDLALAKGLKLSYIDHHMGAAVQTPEMRQRLEKIAADYNLAISRYFGEIAKPVIYFQPAITKTEFLLAEIEKLEEPGIYILVVHPAVKTPELEVLRDLNETGPKDMPDHRQAELDALCDPRLRELLDRKGIELVGYDTLLEKFGDQMRPPTP
jgi:predicted glycoside hydrolase/deacetylase ChbG (UPF0249 family)